MVRSGLISIGILLCLVTASRAEPQLPDLPKTYVSDLAQLLSSEQINQLEKQLSEIEKSGSNQVLVVTVADLQDLPIEDYGIRLAEKWKPGQKNRDNGVILLIAPKDRKMRIEVGYGLEGVLTDALSKNIIETRITPAFRQGDFFSGIQGGVQSIAQVIAGEYQPLPTTPGSSGGDTLAGVLLIAFFVSLYILSRRRGWGRSYGVGHGGWSSGGGGWSGGSSGGGGFSSGGGSFGGGGSSGSW